MKIFTNIRTVAKKIKYMATQSPEAAMEVFMDAAERIKSRMNERKTKTDYPVTWDSERQRRAYFATNGFGAGIPYSRTGNTTWSISKPFENEIDLFAPHPAGALFGTPTANWWRSKIHLETWPDLKAVLTEELNTWPAELFKKLKIVFGRAQNQ